MRQASCLVRRCHNQFSAPLRCSSCKLAHHLFCCAHVDLAGHTLRSTVSTWFWVAWMVHYSTCARPGHIIASDEVPSPRVAWLSTASVCVSKMGHWMWRTEKSIATVIILHKFGAKPSFQKATVMALQVFFSVCLIELRDFDGQAGGTASSSVMKCTTCMYYCLMKWLHDCDCWKNSRWITP